MICLTSIQGCPGEYGGSTHTYQAYVNRSLQYGSPSREGDQFQALGDGSSGPLSFPEMIHWIAEETMRPVPKEDMEAWDDAERKLRRQRADLRRKEQEGEEVDDDDPLWTKKVQKPSGLMSFTIRDFSDSSWKSVITRREPSDEELTELSSIELEFSSIHFGFDVKGFELSKDGTILHFIEERDPAYTGPLAWRGPTSDNLCYSGDEQVISVALCGLWKSTNSRNQIIHTVKVRHPTVTWIFVPLVAQELCMAENEPPKLRTTAICWILHRMAVISPPLVTFTTFLRYPFNS
jgi:hypothetical protein